MPKYKTEVEIIAEPRSVTEWLGIAGMDWEWALVWLDDKQTGIVTRSRSKNGRAKFEYAKNGKLVHVVVVPAPTRTGLIRMIRQWAGKPLPKETPHEAQA